MGDGLSHAVNTEIALVARRHALNVRLITIGLCLGTIEPVNLAQGIRNEQASLHLAQADLVADLDYAGDGQPPWTPAARSFILVSNQNRHGAIPTLARLQHLLGLFLFQYVCTPIGRLLDEKIVDVEKDRAAGEFGEPLCASTFGLSVLHLDRERLLRYNGNHLLKALCKTLLEEPKDRRSVRQTALQDARALKVVETGEEPLASRQVAQLQTFGGANLFDRVRSVFETRLRDLTGTQLCHAMMSARRSTVSVDLERNLTPALRQASAALGQDAVKGFRQTTSSLLVKINGLRLTQHYLADLRTVVETSAAANLRALRALSESLRAVHETLADLEVQIERFANLGPILRFFLGDRAKRLARAYRLAADADLRGQAELALRQALAEHLFRPVLAALGEDAARIDGHIARFEALRSRAQTHLDEAASQPAETLVPVGIEEVTPPFLAERTAAFVADLGGIETLTRRAFQEILQRLGSLQTLAEQDLDTIEKTLGPICQTPFEPPVRALDVLTAFREEYPQRAKQREIVEQLAHEAEGRLLVAGEAGQPITWIKVLGVGSAVDAEPLKDILQEVDREPGTWLVCQHGDPCSVVFVMYRSAISLDGLLRSLRRRHPDHVKPLTPDAGSEPGTFILPSARPTRGEVAVSIVHGLAAGQIERGEGLFTVIDPDTGHVRTGDDPEGLIAVLSHSYPARVRLATAFLRALARERTAVLTRLNELRSGQASDVPDVLRDLVKEEAVLDVERQANLLWPYLQRLPLRRQDQ